MTPRKRKFGVAALLVVIVAVGLFAVLTKREPDPPLAVKFLRYESSNSVVIRLENKSNRELQFSIHNSSVMFEPNSVGGQASRGQIQEMAIRLSPREYLMDKDRTNSALALPTIEVAGVLTPSSLEEFLEGLLEHVGIRSTINTYVMSIEVPAP